jgi:hypothetical protein
LPSAPQTPEQHIWLLRHVVVVSLMHAPLRLGVFIEAPRSAIDRVLDKHPKVRELVDNAWLHLFQIDVGERAVFARRNAAWTPAPP